MAEATANSIPPKQRSVYLITYSQCDSSQLSKLQFANIIVDSWHSRSRSRITQWAVSLEAYQDGGHYFHMAIKLSSTCRLRAIRKYVESKYGRKLNFSDKHDNHYAAYEYVVKEPSFILSPCHPDRSNATPPRYTNATRQRKKGGKVCKDEKRKRLSFDVRIGITNGHKESTGTDGIGVEVARE